MLAYRTRILRNLRCRGVQQEQLRHHAASCRSFGSIAHLQSSPSQRQQQQQQQPQQQQQRTYHATPRKEILPLIGVATVFVIGRYSYKALQRMDAEWEDYQWELQAYERQLQASGGGDAADSQTTTKTIAIDLGSLYTKLATSHPQAQVVVSREGDRAFFNGILYEDNDKDATDAEPSHVVRGRHALERFYYPPPTLDGDAAPVCPVTLPWHVLDDGQTNTTTTTRSAHAIVTDVLGPALDEVLERLDYSPNDASHHDNMLLRSVVTLPARYYLDSTAYRTAFSDLATTLLPEPVAAIWGAQVKGLLPVPAAAAAGHGSGESSDEATTEAATPSSTAAPTTLVVDVGGHTTQLSVVQKDVVLSSISLLWGGERWIQLLVDLLIQDHAEQVSVQDARSLAALQVQARTAVTELSSKTRVDIHVPYIFAEPGNHHLDTTMSRSVWEQAIQHDIRDHLAVTTVTNDDNSNDSSMPPFSPHMPPPSDMASLWMSATTAVLEYANKLPTDLEHVLLVGGASRTPLVSASLQEALFLLLGGGDKQVLVVPESSVASELTVLGAATLLPNYTYSIEDGGAGGLHRLED